MADLGCDYHALLLNQIHVGRTSKGRKGTSWGLSQAFAAADGDWVTNRVMSGLSSGEGLIWNVRDPMEERHPIRQKGHVTGYENVESDPGQIRQAAAGNRAGICPVLQACERETNTLSAIMRQSWESGDLRILTKRQAARATGAHITIVGHITVDELRRLLGDTAVANGFANRFLWVCVCRSKELPFGGKLHGVDFGPMNAALQEAIASGFARNAGEIQRDRDADVIWGKVYHRSNRRAFGNVRSRDISRRTPNHAAGVRVRPAGQVNHSSKEHLLAALEIWRYCEESARFILGMPWAIPRRTKSWHNYGVILMAEPGTKSENTSGGISHLRKLAVPWASCKSTGWRE